jgi:pimeloyl-ACP methyl ester carboxylesterase
MRSSLALFAGAALLAAGTVYAAAPVAKPLYTQSFGTVSPKKVRTLIVVLHGDAPGEKPSYHYAFARSAAQSVPGSVAVAVLRPGYEDAHGHRSPGVRGTLSGDDYTPERIRAVADTIRGLQRRYRYARTVLVGHAGGAAIAADVAATAPGLVDGVVLVSCPCTLPEWRNYMKGVAAAPAWDAQVASLDPIKLVGGIAPGTRAAVLVGAEDKTAPVRFSRVYAEALSLRGIATDFRIVPGRDHELLGDPEVLAATQRLAASLPRSR